MNDPSAGQPEPIAATATSPTVTEAAAVWWRIGVLSFGGPAAQIALMHRTLVDERRWLTEREFLDALGFCMLLPGPEAMQLATLAGRRLHGVRGGLIAGGLFVLPGAVVILVLAALYAQLGALPWMQALFNGIQATVVVIVIDALLKVGKRALNGTLDRLIALAAFIALFALAVPFPVVIVLAAGLGVLRARHDPAATEPPRHHERVTVARTLRTAVLWLLIWWLPLLLIAALTVEPLWWQLGSYFSMLATLSFGGAYALLAWMVQDVVHGFGWLNAAQMLDALGLAETTPGPLILVTEFVGFLAGHRQGGLWWGLGGAIVTLWATFAPCFLWIFALAPWIDRLSDSSTIRAALAAITAAVVGVILNLSLWFSLQVFFAQVERLAIGPLEPWAPVWSSVQPSSVALTLAAMALLLWRRWSLLSTLPVMALAGLLFTP